MPADLEDAADASESPRAAVERDEDAADVDTDSQAERVVVSDNSDDEEEGQPGVDCARRPHRHVTVTVSTRPGQGRNVT